MLFRGPAKLLKIVIVEEKDIHFYPPLMSVVKGLLSLGHEVTLISRGAGNMPPEISGNGAFHYDEIECEENRTNQLVKFFSRRKVSKELKNKTEKAMQNADILWTGSVQTVRDMWRIILKYKNVLQLMELSEYGYSTLLTRFPLEKVARTSWKNVVSERNRAYIEKTLWELSDLPIVLPNKPYSIEYGELTNEMKIALEKMRLEKKKIILYLGGFFADRDLEPYAKAIDKVSEEYALYIIGKAYRDDLKSKMQKLIDKYNITYLGYFEAPHHLAFIQYAFVGLLPYKPVHSRGLSDLNALYCAPNKIYEYAAFSIPMVGSDVLGLREPFEKYDIGYCWDEKNFDELLNILRQIEENYSEMKTNCEIFYNAVNLDEVLEEILR